MKKVYMIGDSNRQGVLKILEHFWERIKSANGFRDDQLRPILVPNLFQTKSTLSANIVQSLIYINIDEVAEETLIFILATASMEVIDLDTWSKDMQTSLIAVRVFFLPPTYRDDLDFDLSKEKPGLADQQEIQWANLQTT